MGLFNFVVLTYVMSRQTSGHPRAPAAGGAAVVMIV